jgi:hypothetical protein
MIDTLSTPMIEREREREELTKAGIERLGEGNTLNKAKESQVNDYVLYACLGVNRI